MTPLDFSDAPFVWLHIINEVTQNAKIHCATPITDSSSGSKSWWWLQGSPRIARRLCLTTSKPEGIRTCVGMTSVTFQMTPSLTLIW
jgi:hypothetical protein